MVVFIDNLLKAEGEKIAGGTSVVSITEPESKLEPGHYPFEFCG
jgi:hypothetical protein